MHNLHFSSLFLFCWSYRLCGEEIPKSQTWTFLMATLSQKRRDAGRMAAEVKVELVESEDSNQV